MQENISVEFNQIDERLASQIRIYYHAVDQDIIKYDVTFVSHRVEDLQDSLSNRRKFRSMKMVSMMIDKRYRSSKQERRMLVPLRHDLRLQYQQFKIGVDDALAISDPPLRTRLGNGR